MRIYLLIFIVTTTVAGFANELKNENDNPSRHLQATHISSIKRKLTTAAAVGQNANGQKRPTGQQNAQKKNGGGQKPNSQTKAQPKTQQPKPKPGQKQNKPKTGTNKKPKPSGQGNKKPTPGNPIKWTPYSLPFGDISNTSLPEQEDVPSLITDQKESELRNDYIEDTTVGTTTSSNKEKVKKGKYKSSRRRQEQESFEEEYEYRKSRNNSK